MTLSLTEARLRWAAAQDLLDPSGGDLEALVARTGWIRTLGGIEAYLALRARCPGLTAGDVHGAVGRGELCVVPAVRSCIYLVPARDVPLALAISEALDARRFARDLDKVDVSMEELDQVGEAAVEVLLEEPRTTRQIGSALPDGLVRRLGDAGKKVGLTTTLPPALRRLEWKGRIRRTPVEDRLDHERYVWSVREQPLADPPEHPHAALARRFADWAGPASLEGFAAWSGLGKRASRAALESAGLEPVEVEEIGPCWQPPGRTSRSPTGRLAGLPGLDNLYALHERIAPLVDAPYRHLEVRHFGRGAGSLADATNVFERLLTRDGAIVGGLAILPDFAVITRAWDAPEEAVAAEAEGISELARSIGSAKTFSLDSDAKLATRAERIRAWSW